MTNELKISRQANISMANENPFSYIPMDVLNMLWFVDGPLKNCERDLNHEKGVFTGYNEPYEFAISIKDPICISYPWDYDNEKYFTYCSYRDLTVVQRGAYIKWLQDIERGSYTRFLKLYMLNVVQCLLELPHKFNAAFNMMIRLYNKYESPWVRDDCAYYLLLSCMSHNYGNETLKLTSNYVDLSCMKHDGDNEALKMALDYVRETGVEMVISTLAVLNEPMTVSDIINYVFNGVIYGLDRKYMRNKPDIFKDALKEILQETFSTEYYPLSIHKPYKMADPFEYYLGKKMYRVFYPDFYRNDDFNNNIATLINKTNDLIKSRIPRKRVYKKKTEV